MEALVLMLTAAIAMAHLCDFLLGAGGQRRLKDGVVELYVATAEGDWSLFVRMIGAAYYSYLCKIFWIDEFSLQTLKRIALFSITISLISHALWFSLDPSPLLAVTLTWPYAGFLVWSLVVNVAFDYGSIALTAHYASLLTQFRLPSSSVSNSGTGVGFQKFKRLQAPFELLRRQMLRLKPLRVLASVSQRCNEYLRPMETLTVSLYGPVGVAFFMMTFAQLAVAQYVLLGLQLDPGERWHLHHQEFAQQGFLENASAFFAAWRHWSVPRFQIALVPLMFNLMATFAVTMYGLGPLVRKPLLLIFERLEESKPGIFTTVAGGLSAMIALIGVLTKWLGAGG